MKRFALTKGKPPVKAELTRNQVAAIRGSGFSASTLAIKYGVSEKEIRDIQSLKTHH